MRILFKGKKTDFSPIFRKKARSAIRFYLQKLNVKKSLLKDAVITVLYGQMESAADVGNLQVYFKDNHTVLDKTKFDIQLSRSPHQTTKTKLTTIAHECVHVKQYITGEMDDVYKTDELMVGTLWKGKMFHNDKHAKRNLDAYYNSPWEIEAYGKMDGLFARWENFYKKKS